MDTSLSPHQIEEIKRSISTSTFTLESEIQKLINSGMERHVAQGLVVGVVNDYRKELFQKSLTKQNAQEAEKVACIVTVMASAVGPVFEVNSVVGHLVIFVITDAAGYPGFRNKPVAGIMACLSFSVIFPFTYHLHFQAE